MSDIESLAGQLLDADELAIATHLTQLFNDPEGDAEAILAAIMPKYSEKRDDHEFTLSPDSIYRPLFYVQGYGGRSDFAEVTRTFLNNVSAHLEGCLDQLSRTPSRNRSQTGPFGPMLIQLRKDAVIPENLADELAAFNRIVNVRSKHFKAHQPTRRLDERTFSVGEASLAFVMMRKLSIQLFEIMRARGVSLPTDWPLFDKEWLTWSPTIPPES